MSGAAARPRFFVAFGAAWLIQVVLAALLMGALSVLMLNSMYMLGGAFAPSSESQAAFFRGLAFSASATAISGAVFTIASLFVAGKLSAKYPANYYSAYAFSGAVVPFTITAVLLSIASLDWFAAVTGALPWAVIGAIALVAAARILRRSRA